MERIAVLGLGAMGSRMAARLVAAGYEVVAYNRTPKALEGARSGRTPAEAAQGARFVLSMVRDDEASRAVWLGAEGAAAAMAPDALAIECSTLSVAGIAALGSAFPGALIEAPVVGTRPHAEDGKLAALVGGEAAHVERARPVLEAFAGKVAHLGPLGAGARAKLVVNAAYATQVAMWSQLLGACVAQGWSAADAVGLLAELPVTSPAASMALRQIAAGAFDPMFPVELVAKDLGYAAALADGMSLIEASRAAFDAAVEAGHGAENITAVSKLYV